MRSAEAISIFERAQFDEGSSRGHTIALAYLEQRRPEEACRKGEDGLTQVPEALSVRSLYEGASFLWDLLGSDDNKFLPTFGEPPSAFVDPQNHQSCLMLADLAASESAKRTGARYQRLEECKFVNLGLSALGNCVAALAKVDSQCN